MRTRLNCRIRGFFIVMINFRRLHSSDLRNIQRVQEETAEALEDRDHLEALSEAEFLAALNGKGLVMGAFEAEVLVAFRVLLFPGKSRENLGRDAGLSNDELPYVVHQELSCVHPQSRGQRLQKKLGAFLMAELAKDYPEMRWVFATVHPDNRASLNDKLEQGMKVIAETEKYEGKKRYILMKKLHC